MNIKYHQAELGLNIELPVLVLEKIQAAVSLHYPKEFGGIFVGTYSNDETTAYISDVIIPQKFTNGVTYFQRKTEDLNEQLKQVYEQSEGKIIYLGEWHSHPNSTSNYSQSDYNAMKHIANDKNVGINNPLMLIFAFNLNTYTTAIYVLKNNKFYKYEEK
jgi:[CysO sulfur-carrier protein]-S-L-cysteine hydrolase